MAYTKDKSFRIIASISRTGLDWNGDHQSRSRNSSLVVRTRTGDRNPNWRSQILNGQNATTPMTGVFDTIDQTPGLLSYNTEGPGAPHPSQRYTLSMSGTIALYCYGMSPNNFDWIPLSTAEAYNRGLTAYLKKVAAVNKSFDGLVFLGELRETVRMIRNPAQGLRNILNSYVDDLRKSKKKSPKNWKKNLSGAWLEHQFGMVPLISDIKNAAEAYNRLVEKPEIVRVSAVGVHERPVPSRTFDQLLQSVSDIYAPAIVESRRATDRAVVRFRGAVKRESRATLAGKAMLFGFDPQQFIPTVWELLPWSFLIDYFSNIGDILEAGVTNQGSIVYTNVSEIKFQILETLVSLGPMYIQSGQDQRVQDNSPSTLKAVRRTVNRYTPLGNLGVPSLTIELPGRPAQWANMTALFTQVNSDLHQQRVKRR